MQEIIIDDAGIRIGLVFLALLLISLLIYICYKITIKSKRNWFLILTTFLYYFVVCFVLIIPILPIVATLTGKELFLSELLISTSLLIIGEILMIWLSVELHKEFSELKEVIK